MSRELLEQVYATLPDGGDASRKDRAAVDAKAGPGAATYGELTLDGVTRLLRWISPSPEDVLFDLGSGTGKIPLLAALVTDVRRAVGVELSVGRHAIALRALAALPAVASRVVFRNEDLGVTDMQDASVVLAGSLAFPDALMATMARRCADLPCLRLLLSLKPLPDASAFIERGSLHVASTWAPRTRVHVYEPR